MTISYTILDSEQTLVFMQNVYDKLFSYRQINHNSAEAGGQLFATITKTQVTIRAITGPRKKDKRSRFSFVPDRVSERVEILKYHLKGFHYIGDWHTHPEAVPQPSMTDIESMRDCYNKSKHELHWFVMVIVGMNQEPSSLYVSLVNDQQNIQLEYLSQ